MGNVESLAPHRVGADCRKWTVLDCLKEAVRRIEDGELDPNMVCIAMRVVTDGLARYPSSWAGVTVIEARGLLATHLAIDMEDSDDA